MIIEAYWGVFGHIGCRRGSIGAYWGILNAFGAYCCIFGHKLVGHKGKYWSKLRHMWPIAVYLGILGHIGHIGAYEGEYWSILRHMGA